jgi:hypothetical protein
MNILTVKIKREKKRVVINKADNGWRKANLCILFII